MPWKMLLSTGLHFPWMILASIVLCGVIFALLAIRLKDCPGPLDLRCGPLFRLRRGELDEAFSRSRTRGRRSGADRRGCDRRKRQKPFAMERRAGTDRRRGDRRRPVEA